MNLLTRLAISGAALAGVVMLSCLWFWLWIPRVG